MTVGAAYAAYLLSPHWLLFSARVKRERGGCCEFCGDDLERLHLHHLTYERIGQEEPEDVIVLCWSCHGDVHEYPKFRREFEAFARRPRPLEPAPDGRTRDGDPAHWFY